MTAATIRRLDELVTVPPAHDFDALVEDVVALWLSGEIDYHECAAQLCALVDRRNDRRRLH